MGLFRSRKTRHAAPEPLPDWDDTRWRSHLRSNALGTDHHCSIYVEMINTDRKEAARLFKNEDDARARQYAESALRNKRIVAALAALSPLCNALYQRSEPLAGYTSLIQLPEPARSGIVTIIFAAGRLQLSYLTETVTFLREQFGSFHIDAIQANDGDLATLVNPTVREALSPTPPDRSDVDAELASSVKEYFGISVASSSAAAQANLNNIPPSSKQQHQQHQSLNPSARSQPIPTPSNHSSELGGPQSPQFSASASSATNPSKNMPIILQPPQQQQQQQIPTRSFPEVAPTRLVEVNKLPPVSRPPQSSGAPRTPAVDDSDDALVQRYQTLRAVVAV